MLHAWLVALAVAQLAASPNGTAEPRAAQLSAGIIRLSGESTVGLASETSQLSGLASRLDSSDRNVSLGGVYLWTPHIGVGLNLGYASTTVSDWAGSVTASRLLVGPVVSLEQPVATRLSLFADAMGWYAYTHFGPGAPSVGGSGRGLGARVGARYFATRFFSLDAAVGYSYLEEPDITSLGWDERTTTSALGLKLGISVYARRRNELPPAAAHASAVDAPAAEELRPAAATAPAAPIAPATVPEGHAPGTVRLSGDAAVELSSERLDGRQYRNRLDARGLRGRIGALYFTSPRMGLGLGAEHRARMERDAVERRTTSDTLVGPVVGAEYR